MRMLLPWTILLLASIAPAAAAERPVVLELFTSQGCSSCPPADRLLSTLAGRADLLPLAFHITYWNALGWRDPFSFEGATERQARYATAFGGNSYTPELVVDGRQAVIGSDSAAVGAAIASAKARLAAKGAATATIAARGGKLEIRIRDAEAGAQIVLVGFDPRHETQVRRGENEGSRLVESNVVRSLVIVAVSSGAPLALVVDKSAGERHAVLVQDENGRILGAAAL